MHHAACFALTLYCLHPWTATEARSDLVHSTQSKANAGESLRDYKRTRARQHRKNTLREANEIDSGLWFDARNMNATVIHLPTTTTFITTSAIVKTNQNIDQGMKHARTPMPPKKRTILTGALCSSESGCNKPSFISPGPRSSIFIVSSSIACCWTACVFAAESLYFAGLQRFGAPHHPRLTCTLGGFLIPPCWTAMYQYA